ncbi:DUF72 domain-containing protein [Mucilaginibacter sp. BJC16-A38]|uniref:DUF72 domain-containing protein n=1 Tax=Mucilaginibacter phenanthrenivorans TaxID=1234842 RepID=UPI0021589B25|nr:DUF72 domain-containing protein [Mucilaginibacter phenanthrenivorans]MCR8561956.1 DUF72 domain-containing protein [Mucilaginibacter phenanthrenivorans]
MEFGHVHDAIADIDFSLPPDTARTKRTLTAASPNDELQVFIGASKWGEKSWIGKIYPKKTPDNALLPFYSQNFNTVEFGPTFYNIYTADELTRWVQQVNDSPDFKFCPKFPQNITHIRRLSNAEEQTAKFYQSLVGFRNHLGPLLLQLGENFSPKSYPNLKAYLEALPSSIKVSVEVRHKDWFAIESNRNDLFQLLQNLNIGTVISDTSGRRDVVHMELTTSEAVIRFVGNDLASSDYTRMDEWVERLKDWKAMGLKAVWFFMHQNNERFVPEACDYLIKKLNDKLGTAIERPKFLNGNL